DQRNTRLSSRAHTFSPSPLLIPLSARTRRLLCRLFAAHGSQRRCRAETEARGGTKFSADCLVPLVCVGGQQQWWVTLATGAWNPRLKMKIALYSHSIPPAVDGVSRRMASLLQQLVKQGHEMLVFTLEKHPQLEPAADPGSKPIRFVTLDSSFLAVYPTKRLAMPTLTNMNMICNTIRLERPDVLHCTLDCISAFFILAAKFYHVPVVGSVHTDVQELLAELNVAPIAGSLITFKEGVESRLLDSCATTSPSFKSKLAGRGVVCDHIIKTGVKVGQFRPGVSNAEVRNRLTFGNPEGLLVVYVGRFGPEKVSKIVK
ncbi:unnamed protein product, partial [Ectocarpus sp. 12 AP-2014]